MPVITLIALGCLVLHLAAGALLKIIAYNTNPKIKSAYDNYLNKTKNLDLKLLELNKEIVGNSNTIKECCAKLKNNKNEGVLSLNANVMGLILSDFLPVRDLIQFRSANKTLSEVFSNTKIVTHRIKESFSIDFINKLGIEQILKAMEHDPFDPLLVPLTGVLLQDALNNQEGSLLDLEKNYDKVLSFEYHAQNIPLIWAHEPNQSKLTLIFNDIKQPSVLNLYNDKYFMVTSHNSGSSWEQNSIYQIGSNICNFMYTEPICKIDEDHYQVKGERGIKETDFFKNFKNPEVLIQI